VDLVTNFGGKVDLEGNRALAGEWMRGVSPATAQSAAE
jgi:hypothetical protein